MLLKRITASAFISLKKNKKLNVNNSWHYFQKYINTFYLMRGANLTALLYKAA